MAERRMFTRQIIDSDAFLDMSASAQSLYFHLGMRADDDGFVNNPKKIQRMVGAADDDLKILIAKRFVIMFETGVIVIKHWKMHNYIAKDRYTPTVYQDERKRLIVKENKAYTENTDAVPVPHTPCIQVVDTMDTQVSIGKDRLGKESIERGASAPAHAAAFGNKHAAYGEYKWVKLTDDEYVNLLKALGEPELMRCIAFVDEAAQKTANKNKWKDWNLVIRACARDKWGIKGAELKRKNAFQGYDQGPEQPGMYETGIDLPAEARELKEGTL